VATASYQMLPDVKLLQPFSGAEAQQLVALCPKKVFDIEDMGTKVPSCP
jgi:DNA-directed RNA polymerases I and III subunit RPAC1